MEPGDVRSKIAGPNCSNRPFVGRGFSNLYMQLRIWTGKPKALRMPSAQARAILVSTLLHLEPVVSMNGDSPLLGEESIPTCLHRSGATSWQPRPSVRRICLLGCPWCVVVLGVSCFCAALSCCGHVLDLSSLLDLFPCSRLLCFALLGFHPGDRFSFDHRMHPTLSRCMHAWTSNQGHLSKDTDSLWHVAHVAMRSSSGVPVSPLGGGVPAVLLLLGLSRCFWEPEAATNGCFFAGRFGGGVQHFETKVSSGTWQR